MKAIVLAAGYATRLYPITLNQPKPLLKIGGRPIIERIIEKIDELDEIDTIYVVTNHKFKPNFDDWLSGYEPKKEIKIIDDGTLSNEDRLGAIGDMNFVIKKENINEDLLVHAGDTLIDFDYGDLAELKKKKKSSVKVAEKLDKEIIAGRFGNLIQDENNKITEFEEKPKEPKSNLASVPIYLFRKEDLQEIENCVKEKPKLDNSGDFIKYLITKKPVYVYIAEKRRYDIGNKEDLKKADMSYGGTGEAYK